MSHYYQNKSNKQVNFARYHSLGLLTRGYYWYSREPKVSPNSFWFIPSADIGPVYIPKNSEKYNIKLEDSVLKPRSTGGFWTHTIDFSKDSAIEE